MATELTDEKWTAVLEARVKATAATYMVLMHDGLGPSSASLVVTSLDEQDAGVRGNRPANGIPTWDDARLCLAATLRECLAMLDARD